MTSHTQPPGSLPQPVPTPKTIIFFSVHDKIPDLIPTLASYLYANFTNIALISPSFHPNANLSWIEAAIKENITSPDLTAPKVLTQAVDIRSPESIALASHNIRATLGAWDVFVNCTALCAPLNVARTTIRGADEDDWWEPFERNVRTLHSIARHFLPKMKGGAVFVSRCLLFRVFLCRDQFHCAIPMCSQSFLTLCR